MEELGDAADKFGRGEVRREDLPMIAAHALARGVDSPALGELAGLHRNDSDGAAELFRVALVEVGLLDPDAADWPGGSVEVLLRRVRHRAERLVAGAGCPACHGGAIAAGLVELHDFGEPWESVLGRRVWDFELPTIHWDERPDDRASLTREMRAAAAELLDALPCAAGFSD
ncbi:hypothetical protein AB0H76_14080 [Nocardia sp. NPDC050712]|uniref:hypothetical protein n=1 Tax=Nocardia sp. NPDC050712 TaxID=3155518 RepID=UPI0033E9B462